jgi:hypothetical protein
LDKIEAHNEKFKKGEEDYEMGEYEFDDEDPEEVLLQKAGAKRPKNSSAATKAPKKRTTVKPKSQTASNSTVDWRSVMLPDVDQKVKRFE